MHACLPCMQVQTALGGKDVMHNVIFATNGFTMQTCESISPDGVWMYFIMHDSVYTRVCNRLSGYSGYSDIRKNLSVRIVI